MAYASYRRSILVPWHISCQLRCLCDPSFRTTETFRLRGRIRWTDVVMSPRVTNVKAFQQDAHREIRFLQTVDAQIRRPRNAKIRPLEALHVGNRFVAGAASSIVGIPQKPIPPWPGPCKSWAPTLIMRAFAKSHAFTVVHSADCTRV